MNSPVVTVLHGRPTAEEIAAIVMVIGAAAAGTPPSADRRPPELWGRPTDLHRDGSPFSPSSYSAHVFGA